MLEPKLIAFEGGECAGKSTVIKALKEWIEENGQECVVVKVPGETEPGKEIRKIIVGEHNTKMSKTVNGLLYTADWVNTLETIVVPALARGAVVLADRSNVTMYSYQHESPKLRELMAIADEIKTVDRVILIESSYQVFMERLSKRDKSLNNERDYISEDTFNQYTENYRKYAKEFPERTKWVNGNNTPFEILLAVKYAIRDYGIGK